MFPTCRRHEPKRQRSLRKHSLHSLESIVTAEGRGAGLAREGEMEGGFEDGTPASKARCHLPKTKAARYFVIQPPLVLFWAEKSRRTSLLVNSSPRKRNFYVMTRALVSIRVKSEELPVLRRPYAFNCPSVSGGLLSTLDNMCAGTRSAISSPMIWILPRLLLIIILYSPG